MWQSMAIIVANLIKQIEENYERVGEELALFSDRIVMGGFTISYVR